MARDCAAASETDKMTEMMAARTIIHCKSSQSGPFSSGRTARGRARSRRQGRPSSNSSDKPPAPKGIGNRRVLHLARDSEQPVQPELGAAEHLITREAFADVLLAARERRRLFVAVAAEAAADVGNDPAPSPTRNR